MFTTAVQMWTLARYLPIIIGHRVPNDDENWINYLSLWIILWHHALVMMRQHI